MYTVYILYSSVRDKYYTGFTGDDIQERLRKHNSNHKGFTGSVGDWKIIHAESFSVKDLAIKRELEIKSWKSTIAGVAISPKNIYLLRLAIRTMQHYCKG